MINKKSTSLKKHLLTGMMTSAFLCLPTNSLSAGSAYNGEIALANYELASLRGTYTVGGIEFTMGLEQLTRLNGEIIDSTSLSLSDMFSDDGLFGEDGVFGDGGVFGGGVDVDDAPEPEIPVAVANLSPASAAPKNDIASPVQFQAPDVNVVTPEINLEDVPGIELTKNTPAAIPTADTSDIFGKGGTPLSPTNIPTPAAKPAPTKIAAPISSTTASSAVNPVKIANNADLGRIISITADAVNVQQVPGFNTFIQNSRNDSVLQYTQILNITAEGANAQRNIVNLGGLANQAALFSLK